MSEAIWGFIGVCFGAGLSILGDLIKDRRSTKRHANYAAIRIVCALDDFVERCVAVVEDEGEYVPRDHGQEELEALEDMPDSPSFAEDVDWKSMDSDFTYRALSISSILAVAKSRVSAMGEFASPPDYEEWFQERKRQFVRLGRTGLKLSVELKARYALRPGSSDDSHSERLEKAARTIEDAVAEHDAGKWTGLDE
ncbi:MAG: hypothetical protein HYX36_01550 [Rhizobiales bacterium]|nr:hypothetical protein [Hyphomicrobiales bacterium]